MMMIGTENWACSRRHDYFFSHRKSTSVRHVWICLSKPFHHFILEWNDEIVDKKWKGRTCTYSKSWGKNQSRNMPYELESSSQVEDKPNELLEGTWWKSNMKLNCRSRVVKTDKAFMFALILLSSVNSSITEIQCKMHRSYLLFGLTVSKMTKVSPIGGRKTYKNILNI